MSILGDKIKAAELGGDRRSCDLELGDEIFTIYSSPLTGRDFDRITKVHPTFVTNPSVAAQVDMIIMKAQNENGDLAFDKIDKQVLVKQPLEWIMKIRTQLFSDDEDFSEGRIEEDEKN